MLWEEGEPSLPRYRCTLEWSRAKATSHGAGSPLGGVGRGLKPPPTGMVHLWGDWSRAEATSHRAGSPMGEVVAG